MREELVELRNQFNIATNVIAEMQGHVDYFLKTQKLQEPIIITHDNINLERAFDSFCQFAVQINDKVSEISKKVLSNEHKIVCLDDKISNFTNNFIKKSDFELDDSMLIDVNAAGVARLRVNKFDFFPKTYSGNRTMKIMI